MRWAFLKHTFNRVEKFGLQPIRVATRTRNNSNPVEVHNTKNVHVEKRFISRLNNDPLADAIQHNEIIEQQLDTILQELDCDQVYIAQFHNGGHFYPTGKSIQKFSVFYEITTPDTNSLKTAFQNIPVSLFSKQFAVLYEKGEIVVEDMNVGPSYGLDLTKFSTFFLI